eukprot:279073-Pyramimonas_sp.AAC.1
MSSDSQLVTCQSFSCVPRMRSKGVWTTILVRYAQLGRRNHHAHWRPFLCRRVPAKMGHIRPPRRTP